MKRRKIVNGLLLLMLNLFSLLCFSQETFTTNLKYNVNWNNQAQYDYHTEVIPNRRGINSSCLIKFDNRYIAGFDNIFIEHIYQNVNLGKFKVLSKLGAEELNSRERFEAIHWKFNIDIHSMDTIKWCEWEDIQSVKLHQEWSLDTLKGELANRLLGLTLIRVENDTSEVEMFYIEMNNSFKSDIINEESVVYIQQLNNKFSWNGFPKEQISRLLVDKEKSYTEITDSNTSKYVGNEKAVNLDSIYKNNDLDVEDLEKTILHNTDGINLNQLLYIDLETNSINTMLNGIAPLFPIYNDKGVFKYYKPLYWLNF